MVPPTTSSRSTISLGSMLTGPSQIEMIVTVPFLRVARSAVFSVCSMPAASKAWSVPSPPVSSRTRCDHVLLAGIDDLVGAELERLALPGLGDLGDQDLPRAQGLQAQHGDRADRSRAEHERALPGLHPGPPDGAQADGDRLDQRAVLAREPGGQLMDHVRRHHRVLRHAAAPAHSP